MDPRYIALARNLVSHSTNLQTGEKVLLHAFDIPEKMTLAHICAQEKGRSPLCRFSLLFWIESAYLVQRKNSLIPPLTGKWSECRRWMPILPRGSNNVFENSDLPPEDEACHEVNESRADLRVKKTKWCILRWPSPSMAQQAKMSSEAFEKFLFDACCMNYGRMKDGMAVLESRMQRADQVKITGPGTNLSFSLKGISAVACGGTHNIPDGEAFSVRSRIA